MKITVAVGTFDLLPGCRRPDLSLFHWHDTPGTSPAAPPSQEPDSIIDSRINGVVRRGILDFLRQAAIVLVAGAAPDDLTGVNHGIDVRGKCENLAHIDPVIAAEAVPPFHMIAPALVPCRQTHERQIGKSAVAVNVDQTDVHIMACPISGPGGKGLLNRRTRPNPV